MLRGKVRPLALVVMVVVVEIEDDGLRPLKRVQRSEEAKMGTLVFVCPAMGPLTPSWTPRCVPIL